MVSGIYNRFFANLMNKLINLGNGGDVLKVMLLNNTHAFNADNNIKGDIVANEITGTLYTAGGKTLGSQTVTQDDVSDLAKFDGADVIWGPGASFTAYHAAMYDSTVSDNLICSIDFGAAKIVSNGTFTIQWNASGIIALASA